MQYAPIALFTYNRADKTKRVLESLIQNAEAKGSDLYIFSDGPKNEKAVEGVKKNREYIHLVKETSKKSKWFKDITIIEREKNWGLANSLIAGITEVINKYGRVIVVEDDLILSPYFLKFMNDGLEKYKDDEKVGTISAYVPPVETDLPDTFFLMYFQCWGWATWKRAWDLLETDTRVLLRKMRFKKNKFDVGGGCGNYGNLYCHKVGLVDTWYLRYYASLFLEGKLSLYPGHTLAVNNGMDGTGVHCKADDMVLSKAQFVDKQLLLDNIPVEENSYVYNAFKSYFSKRIHYDTRYYYQQFKSFIRRLLYIDSK